MNPLVLALCQLLAGLIIAGALSVPVVALVLLHRRRMAVVRRATPAPAQPCHVRLVK